MSPELKQRLERERQLRREALERFRRRAPARIAVGFVRGGYRAARDLARIILKSGPQPAVGENTGNVRIRASSS